MTLADTAFDTFTLVLPPALHHSYILALDLTLANGTTDQAIAALLAPVRHHPFSMNAHFCNTGRRNPVYARALAQADIMLPDGVRVDLSARMSAWCRWRDDAENPGS